jgi:hypothetical protein
MRGVVSLVTRGASFFWIFLKAFVRTSNEGGIPMELWRRIVLLIISETDGKKPHTRFAAGCGGNETGQKSPVHN